MRLEIAALLWRENAKLPWNAGCMLLQHGRWLTVATLSQCVNSCQISVKIFSKLISGPSIKHPIKHSHVWPQHHMATWSSTCATAAARIMCFFIILYQPNRVFFFFFGNISRRSAISDALSAHASLQDLESNSFHIRFHISMMFRYCVPRALPSGSIRAYDTWLGPQWPVNYELIFCCM